MSLVLVRQDADIRWIRLNRPGRRNALNPDLVAALDEAITAAIADPRTSVVVIAGEGPSFCAGADLRYLRGLADDGQDPLPFLTEIADCFTRIERAQKPVIAAVHGHAVAGGLELALACDVVIAQAGTLIGDGHIRHGLLPAGGSSVRLPRKVGEPLARWLILTGELLPAETFTASGFIHQVVAAHQFTPAVTAVAARLRARAGVAQASAKQLLTDHLHRDGNTDRDAGLIRERKAFAANWHRNDNVSALTRFTERGTPAQEGSPCDATPTGS
jgi:enoyl-CoA hydratase/carnithine racemase